MIDHIVLDIETQVPVDELDGKWDDTHKMGISCACVWEAAHERMRVYGPDDADRLQLQTRILQADRVTTFNGWSFDFPVIWQMSRKQWLRGFALPDLAQKSDDLLLRIREALAVQRPGASWKGWSLNDVALGTLGVGKIDSGAHAPALYRAGRWSELVTYCQDDVALTRDLAHFVDRYGFVLGGVTHLRLELRP